MAVLDEEESVLVAGARRTRSAWATTHSPVSGLAIDTRLAGVAIVSLRSWQARLSWESVLSSLSLRSRLAREARWSIKARTTLGSWDARKAGLSLCSRGTRARDLRRWTLDTLLPLRSQWAGGSRSTGKTR